MAISTFAELQTAITNWFSRTGDTDWTSRVPEFIALAESEINRRLRTADMETRVSATLLQGTEYIGLPANFGGLRGRPKLTNTDPIRFLEYMTPSHIDSIHASSQSLRPRVYSIVGNELRIRPLADQDYTVELLYYLKVPSLSVSATTNWLLTDHPDIYLKAGLAQGADYMEQENTAAKWRNHYQNALEGLVLMDKKDRWSGAPLQMRSDVMGV